MQPVGVVGVENESPFLDVLLDHLSGRGAVALVTSGTGKPERKSTAEPLGRPSDSRTETTVTLAPDGSWTVTGNERREVGDLLYDLAPGHEYVVLVGFPGADVPTIAVDGEDETNAGETDDYEGRPLVSVSSADDPDLDVLDAMLADASPYETLESLVERAKESTRSEYAGALATFTGRVRAKDGEADARTTALEFEKYDGIAEEKMDAIGRELTDRDGVFEVVLHHRDGVVPAESDIVFVVVLAGHREEAFSTVSDGIDRLKDEVPLFKKEITVDGEHWKHESFESHPEI